MSTIRPFLASGVRLDVVPANQENAYQEELPDLDFSEELEGSCELMSELEADQLIVDKDKEREQHQQQDQKRRKVIKQWLDSQLENPDEPTQF